MNGLIADGVWVQGIYGVLLFFGALAMYLNRPKAPPPANSSSTRSIISGIGAGWTEVEATERFLAMIERCTKSLETLADKKQNEVTEKLDELLRQLKETERANEHRESVKDDPRRR